MSKQDNGEENHPGEAALRDQTRRELIEYYKWIVKLALFVLAVSLTLARFFPAPLRYSWLFVLGWVLLGVCIFVNWLIVKRLVSLPIVTSVPEEHRGILHAIFLETMPNLKAYGLIQNGAFLLGVVSLGLGFVLNIIGRSRG